MIAHTAPARTLFDLQRPEVIADPWPFYEGLRAESPYWDPTVRSWLVAGHADVARLLNDPSLSAVMDHARAATYAPRAMRHLYPLLDAHVSFMDGEAHAQVRRVLADPFRPSKVRGWESFIAAAVTEALDHRVAAGRLDAVGDLAYPIPLRVVQEMLGLDEVDLPTLRRWSNAWGDVIAAPGHVPTGDTGPMLRAVDELLDQLRATVAAHRRTPRDTVTGLLVAAVDRHELTELHLLANLMMLVTAGHETTANLIANAVAALLDDPALADRLRHAPELLPAAVDELVRLHPPTQYTARTARAEVEVGGRQIQAGQSVVLLLAAANRDPDVFPDPDRVRLDRPARVRPLAFGNGPHFCFGAALAQAEARITLAGLLARCADLRPDGERRWRANANLRGLASLPLAFTLAKVAP